MFINLNLCVIFTLDTIKLFMLQILEIAFALFFEKNTPKLEL